MHLYLFPQYTIQNRNVYILFQMVYCGIWDRCIVAFVWLVYCDSDMTSVCVPYLIMRLVYCNIDLTSVCVPYLSVISHSKPSAKYRSRDSNSTTDIKTHTACFLFCFVLLWSYLIVISHSKPNPQYRPWGNESTTAIKIRIVYTSF